MYYRFHKKVSHMGPTIFISNANLTHVAYLFLEPIVRLFIINMNSI